MMHFVNLWQVIHVQHAETKVLFALIFVLAGLGVLILGLISYRFVQLVILTAQMRSTALVGRGSIKDIGIYDTRSCNEAGRSKTIEWSE